MNKAIIGRKVGMTQLFAEDGKLIPVTVVEAGLLGSCTDLGWSWLFSAGCLTCV